MGPNNVGGMQDCGVHHHISLAFQFAPLGLLLSQHRTVRAYNAEFAKIFGFEQVDLTGTSLSTFYPTEAEFVSIGERAISIMLSTGRYQDERLMRRSSGSLFWCRVLGAALNHKDPFDSVVWTFQDLSAERPFSKPLTPRERDVARLLVEGKSTKAIAYELQISIRTVEAHRARLGQKFGASTAAQLIGRLVGRT